MFTFLLFQTCLLTKGKNIESITVNANCFIPLLTVHIVKKIFVFEIFAYTYYYNALINYYVNVDGNVYTKCNTPRTEK